MHLCVILQIHIKTILEGLFVVVPFGSINMSSHRFKQIFIPIITLLLLGSGNGITGISDLDTDKIGIETGSLLTYNVTILSDVPSSNNNLMTNQTVSYEILRDTPDELNEIIAREDIRSIVPSQTTEISEITINLSNLLGIIVYTDWKYWESLIFQSTQPFELLPNIDDKSKLYWSSSFPSYISEQLFNVSFAEVTISDAIAGNVAVNLLASFNVEFNKTTGVVIRSIFQLYESNQGSTTDQYIQYQLVDYVEQSSTNDAKLEYPMHTVLSLVITSLICLHIPKKRTTIDY